MGNTLKIKRTRCIYTNFNILNFQNIPQATDFLITLSYLESKTIQKNTIHFTYILF